MTGLTAAVTLTRGSLELDATLEAPEGETIALVGPNGAGKTTLLRALAGLEPLAAGSVILDGDVLEDVAAGTFVPPERRRVGFVFQDEALFPHLSVLDNVAFPLRARGDARGAARAAAAAALQAAGLGELAAARPGALSGGQAQRVALVRALVGQPRLLLMDEPLAALDATTAARTRRDVQRFLSDHRGVRIVVTHDPLDAATIGDRIVVLERGRVVQEGTIDELSAHPRSPFVADLVGVNVVRGRMVGGDELAVAPGFALHAAGTPSTGAAPSAGADAVAVFHPRAVALHRARPEGTARNVWEGWVDGIERDGARARVRVVGPITIVAEVTIAAVDQLALAAGAPVWASLKATEVTLAAS